MCAYGEPGNLHAGARGARVEGVAVVGRHGMVSGQHGGMEREVAVAGRGGEVDDGEAQGGMSGGWGGWSAYWGRGRRTARPSALVSVR